MLKEPEHGRVACWDLPLDPPRERHHLGADQPLELLGQVPDGPVGLRLAGQRGLNHHLSAELLSYAQP
eukprot:10232131-Alexandrium_andersonii.AAC.1